MASSNAVNKDKGRRSAPVSPQLSPKLSKDKAPRARRANGTPQVDARYACYRIKIAPSKIHRWGMYTTEDIPARHKVIEYMGEKINRRETKRRAEASDLIYLFTLDPYWTIDGSVNGSGAQYINHSCEPNLVARIVKGHILYMSLRDIKKGEELTVDYHFDKKVERVPCGCGTAKCRGTINVL